MKRSRFFLQYLVLGLTFCFFIVEWAVGLSLHSLALTSDAFHMLSDSMALCIALLATYLQKNSKTTLIGGHVLSFGWKRAEILGALCNSIFLVAIVLTIFADSIIKLIYPERIQEPMIIVWVGLGGLGLNILAMLAFGGHGHSHGHSHSHGHGHSHTNGANEKDNSDSHTIQIETQKTFIHNESLEDDLHCTSSYTTNSISNSISNDSNPISNIHPIKIDTLPKQSLAKHSLAHRAIFLHILLDVFGSILVIVSALVQGLAPWHHWYMYIDPIVSILLVIGMLYHSTPIIKESLLLALESRPRECDMENIIKEIQDIEPGLSIIHSHIWRLYDQVLVANLHVRLENLDVRDMVMERIKQILHAHHIHSSTIEFEMESNSPSLTESMPLLCSSTCQEKTCC